MLVHDPSISYRGPSVAVLCRCLDADKYQSGSSQRYAYWPQFHPDKPDGAAPEPDCDLQTGGVGDVLAFGADAPLLRVNDDATVGSMTYQ
jgi:hypothetical protein